MVFKQFKGLINRQEGIAVVLVALCLTVLVGMLALVGDIGLLFLTKTQLARAADAAALAGAARINEGEVPARLEAQNYLQANGITAGTGTIEIDLQEKTVTVRLRQEVNYFFAPLFGETSNEVSVQAVGQNGSISAAKGVAPVGIEDQQLIYGEPYVLKWSSDLTLLETPFGPGNFGILNFGNHGGGASDYRQYAAKGYSEFIKVGDVIPAETGNKSGPTLQGFGERIQSCEADPPCSWQDYEADCPRIVTIPVYQILGGSGSNQEYKIVGFAAFWLEEIGGHGNENYVSGYFIQKYLPGEIEIGQNDYGLRSVKLIQ